MPGAVKCVPQVPFVHVRVAQSVSIPGQSEAVRHCTQLPLPSHSVPPLWSQVVPAVSGGFDGTPLVQTSPVHSFPSTGTSVSSATLTTFPAPSHSFTWQSPVVCCDVGVPAEVKLVPQVPSTHVRVAQSVSVPGQSVPVTHWTVVEEVLLVDVEVEELVVEEVEELVDVLSVVDVDVEELVDVLSVVDVDVEELVDVLSVVDVDVEELVVEELVVEELVVDELVVDEVVVETLVVDELVVLEVVLDVEVDVVMTVVVVGTVSLYAGTHSSATLLVVRADAPKLALSMATASGDGFGWPLTTLAR